eukprot:6228557-Prymnesium_polylepis.1
MASLLRPRIPRASGKRRADQDRARRCPRVPGRDSCQCVEITFSLTLSCDCTVPTSATTHVQALQRNGSGSGHVWVVHVGVTTLISGRAERA